MSFKSLVALALWMVAATAALGAENHAIDAEHSTLTVFVEKSGFLSAFADDHVIRAPIASGLLGPWRGTFEPGAPEQEAPPVRGSTSPAVRR